MKKTVKVIDQIGIMIDGIKEQLSSGPTDEEANKLMKQYLNIQRSMKEIDPEETFEVIVDENRKKCPQCKYQSKLTGVETVAGMSIIQAKCEACEQILKVAIPNEMMMFIVSIFGEREKNN